MKRYLPLLSIWFSGAAMAALAISFGNVRASVGDDGRLEIIYSLNGLQSGASDIVHGYANVTAVYACVNRGGNAPRAANKRTTYKHPTVGTATAQAKGNGSVTGKIFLPVPQDPSFSCPNGQTKALMSVQYSNVRVQESSSDASTAVPGTFQKTLQGTTR